MSRHLKMLYAALTAALMLALSGGIATANTNLVVSGGGRAILAISLTARLTFRGDNGVDLISLVTLHGSVHASTSKTAGSLFGIIKETLVAECRTNVGIPCSAIGLANMHLRFLSFEGTLPNITGLRILIDARFLIRLGDPPNPLECLYQGTVGATITGRARPGEFAAERGVALPNTNNLVHEINGEFFRRCPRTGELNGGFTFAPAITVRLA